MRFNWLFEEEFGEVFVTFAGVFACGVDSIVAIEAALAVLTEAAHRVVLTIDAHAARFRVAA
jgi:hypothetical protein